MEIKTASMSSITDKNTFDDTSKPSSACRYCYNSALDLAGQISTDLKLVFQESSYVDSHVETLVRHVNSIIDARPSNEVRFAFIGHMGCGKSSLINALLGIFDIARKDSRSGHSCTWMIQEFRRCFPEQKAPFRAEIEFYDELELEKLFSLMVHELQNEIISARSTNREQQEDDDAEQVTQRGYAHIPTFRALFHDKPEFSSEDSTKAFASQTGSETDRSIVRRMTSWAAELISQAEQTFESTTPSDLLQQLRKYTHGPVVQDEDEHIFWPLVKKVAFGLTGCALLDDGVVLVDMPGSHDINPIQELASRRALRECNYYVTAATISRALSDDTLNDYLDEGSRRKQVVAILTKSDDVDVSPSPRQVELIAELLDLKERRLRAERENRAKQKAALVLQEEEVEEQLRTVEAKGSKASAIMDRNVTVTRDLRESYKTLTGDERPLDVFAVSSKTSEQHQRGYVRDLELTEEQSGVPALQNYLIQTTVERRFNDAVYLYETLKQHIVSFREISDGQVQQFLDSMKKKEQHWIERASTSCDAWEEKYDTTQYWSLAKENGVKKCTKKFRATDCNKDLAFIVKRSMTTETEGLINFAEGQRTYVNTLLEAPLTDMENAIRRDKENYPMLPESLVEQFKLHKKGIAVPLSKCFARSLIPKARIGRGGLSLVVQ
ncbi:hypothetical protein AUEXF2481DRAFT_26439 [Aureobasidium subglaciale EXF-2481]|uniref:Dynamin N-terminal domain-containing protein n=1 Tax=Aureobasidium subglaciale (strain EXF-2481) TaxID=1043005 RepID=A0A074YSV2_AURSE|nr:uncharacterized protein AUEXF2481DRAFT_26439 [Aureobasidium subglaciale EXF-2481]KAI5207673.1 hypothetical protein E4T38_03280 [Aureobasidium subglaciale]KAI5226576.1 hypothetical protein E4T40_03054 [Aureobasidium subglaciale]KAI5229931.1 hypothetical protein E4T41_03277 [Aureobasidium subglaciale]KAI5264481.1 hypothetical protein E4T46_03055 [Aureobasidium subglaciale]KEQ99219.1 hypothetical protein AUEXF2481DRAFT_26439 [Aureobasidium subglaciale EXF-2481]